MICNCACRCVLTILNTLTLIVGVILLIIGALMTWGQSFVEGLLDDFILRIMNLTSSDSVAQQTTEFVSRILTASGPIGLTVFSIGAAISILSVIGYVGSCCNLKILLKIYAIIIGVVALAVLLIIIVYFARKDWVGQHVVGLFNESVVNYQSMKTNDVHSLVIGLVQPKLKCCGTNGPSDFVKLLPDDRYGGKDYQNLQHPIPCCQMDSKYVITGKDCPAKFVQNNSYIDTACKELVQTKFIEWMNIAVYILIATLLILLLLIAFTVLTIRFDVV